ncbi:MAG: hypothetical protein IPK22_22495 [Verrucomicrobiaceae bacterium]|nr:hypothetical protein [Verrucomicrobiaceae bacterium]
MPAYLYAPSGHCCELPPRPAVVGTDPQCDIPLVGVEGVTARHCELRPSPHGLELHKLDSAAFLRVNGAPVTGTLVNDGDVISIGSLSLTLSLPQEAAAAQREAGQREEMEGFSEAEKKKRRAQMLMEDNWRRTQERYEEFRRKQSFPLAIVGAVFGLVVSAIGFSLTSMTSWRAYFFLIIAVGFVVGWIIRLTGRGVERRFGVLAVIAMVLGVVGTTGYESYMYMVHGQLYTHEAVELSAEEKAMIEETKRENAQRAALIAAEAAEMDKIGRRKLAEDDPFNILDAKRNEDLRTRDEILAEAAKPTPEMHLMGFLLRLISPKNLAAYILAGIAAYRASFRYLSNVEASELHRTPPVVSNESRAKSLRERLEMQS